MRAHALGACVTLLIVAASTTVRAGDTQSDLGAGPVAMRITPCLIAAKTGKGTPCPEPQMRNGGDAAEQVAGHLARAHYFIDLEDLPAAAAETDAAIAANPNVAAAHHLAARIALAMFNKEGAEREIAIARAQAPDDLDVHATYATVLEMRPARTEALAELNEVLQSNPNHMFARLERARLNLGPCNPCETLADLEFALSDLDFLIKADPHSVIYLQMHADTLMKLGRPQDAVADLSAALVIKSGDFHLFADRVKARELAGDYAAALADLSAILGPVGGPPAYAVGGNQYAQLLEQRAMILVHSHSLANAATDMMTAINFGGRPAVLRTQIFLRQNGFPETPLDGKTSPKMQTALEACFAFDSCFAAIKRDI